MTLLQSYRSRWPVLRTLIFGTLVCYVCLLVRCWLMQGLSRSGVCANILLAWIPCLLAIALDFLLARRPVPKISIVLLGVLWLLFLPNAAYIVTDLVHWTKDKQLPKWFDWIFITSCAWVGLFLGYEAIVLLHRRITRTWGDWIGWGFVIAACGLSSTGIYFGRFMRWNSWDVVRKPAAMAAQVVGANFADLAAFCLTYSIFIFAGYCMIHGVAAQARRDVNDPSVG